MKFACYKSDLAAALKFVANAIAAKPQTPILSGIYLDAQESSLEIHANNFSLGIIAKIPVHVEEKGATVVSGKRLVDFVKAMPDDTISFSTERNTLKLESGGANVELLTMSPNDFPKVKAPEGTTLFSLPAVALHEVVNRSVFAASKDESRPIFTGVLFEFNDNLLTCVATDTHRLALAKTHLYDHCDAEPFVVPADTLRVIVNRIDPKNPDAIVSVYKEKNSLAFKFDNVCAVSRLVDGSFPPYQKILDVEANRRVSVDTNEFKDAVNFIALMSKETEYNTVQLALSQDAIDISANSNDVGEAVLPVEAQMDGDDLEIFFNVNYIADFLKVASSKKILLAFKDKYDPAIFTMPGNDSCLYLVTPVRG